LSTIGISRTVAIRDQRVAVDAVLTHDYHNADTDYLSHIYKSLDTAYPKFYKMDQPSRLAWIASELLLRHQVLSAYAPDRIGLICSTHHGCQDTDTRYWQTVQEVASPALFVYTLPNVMLGEVCIRHQIKGENTCFIQEQYDADFQTQYVNGLILNGQIDCCISGWVDYHQGVGEAFFMLIEKNQAYLDEHTSSIVQKRYSQTWNN
jgi:hypothetical protein